MSPHMPATIPTREKRHFSFVDRVLSEVDHALKVLTPGAIVRHRTPELSTTHESNEFSIEQWSPKERRLIGGLMRINHCGEICAQALYQGQAATAKSMGMHTAMRKAAEEELDHLYWCDERLQEIQEKPSIFNPIFYGASFMLGAAAGLAGDRWSLGFVVETEKQVGIHLEKHLAQLPLSDAKSQRILQCMKIEELQHQQEAEKLGAASLPPPVKLAMRWMSSVMTTLTYKI
ncbi:MAG: 2-polyprenyl-3-methyl-6-methoxy-1,4-benzoquinone monooxygenase [Pseudomonadota bacterium]